MSIPEKEKEVSSAPPTNTEEEEDRQDEVELLAGVSNEDCHPTEEREEKEDQSVIQSKEKKDKEEGEEVNSGSKKSCDAETILGILLDGGYIHELFLDQYQTPYAAIKVNDHVETISMRTKASGQFKNWICYISYKELGIIPKDETINSVLNFLSAEARYGENKKVRKLYLRAGPGDNPNEILYDLTNKDWEFVRITPELWSIEKSSTNITPVFKRHRNQLEQVHPSKGYPNDIFDQFMKLLNVKDENAILLLKVYIILLVYYKIQKPILAPYGEQGSAKSTLHEYIKQLIDPSAAITLAFPRDINELVLKLDQNYIAYFDNISKIPEWISDQLCRAVTGSGFSKRQLYTDEDAIICSFKRALGFNGINLAATKADLLDRCLIIMLERIKEDKREPLEDIVNIKGLNQELERIKPQLLGFIFDTLCKVLKTISTNGITRPKELPRMADFALHGEIVARCLGYDENVFLNAFNENIRLQSDELLETNPLAMAVFQFVEWEPEFKGSATQLLKEINLKASELGIQTDKFWPKGPGVLSRRLNLIRTSLRRIGVDIEFLQHQGKEGKSREIRVCKIPTEASVSTVTSDISPNQTRIKFDASDDITDDSNKIPTEKLAQNYAQNGTSDDTDNSDDTFHITSPLALTSNSYQQQPPYNNGNEKASSGETAGAHSSLIPSSQQTMTNDSPDISQENSTNNIIEENERPSSIIIKSSEPSEPSVIGVGKSNDKNDKSQNTTTESMKAFKCFYCDQLCLDDMERVTHIDSEHPGKLYYPTPEDFEKRLDQQGETQ